MGLDGTHGMNPEKCTDAPSLGASRHPFRYLKVCKPSPDASMVHAENRKIFGLDSAHVVLVCYCQRTTFEFIKSMGMKRYSRRFGTRVVEIIRISNVPSL